MPAAAFTLLASLALLSGYVVYRLWEEKRGVKIWTHARESADVFVSDAYRKAVTGNIPSDWRDAFLKFMHQLSHAAVVLTVEVLRAIERPLLRLSHRMRRGGAPTGTGKEPSEFLKTITPIPKEMPNSETKGD